MPITEQSSPEPLLFLDHVARYYWSALSSGPLFLSVLLDVPTMTTQAHKVTVLFMSLTGYLSDTAVDDESSDALFVL